MLRSGRRGDARQCPCESDCEKCCPIHGPPLIHPESRQGLCQSSLRFSEEFRRDSGKGTVERRPEGTWIVLQRSPRRLRAESLCELVEEQSCICDDADRLRGSAIAELGDDGGIDVDADDTNR